MRESGELLESRQKVSTTILEYNTVNDKSPELLK